jgi:hypothetical protein
MNRHRVFAVLIVALVLVGVSAYPAAAAPWFAELRYWPANVTWTITGGSTPTWKTNMYGVTVMRDIHPSWYLSFNGDWGGEANWTLMSPTRGNDHVFNINLHRRFVNGPAQVSVFAGWGQAGWRQDFGGLLETFRVNGPRLGANLAYQRGPWALRAWGAFGVANRGVRESPGFTDTASGASAEYGAKIIYNFASGWGVDAGYRVVTIRWDGTATYLPSKTEWSGLIVGVTRIFP